MDRDLLILTRGALLGLACTLVAEWVRYRLDQNRAAAREAEEVREKRNQEIAGFLHRDGAEPVGPAWLRQVNTARRPPLARLGLRRDEEFATAAYKVAYQSAYSAAAPFPADSPTRRRMGSAAVPLKGRASGTAGRLLRRLAGRPPPFRLPPFSLLRSRMPGLGSRFLLGPVQVIGRGPQCDIRVLDPAVSLVHALLRCEAGGYVLYDLGSTCGAWVDGCRVGSKGRALRGGERIILGDTEFVFGAAASGLIPPAPPAPPAGPPLS